MNGGGTRNRTEDKGFADPRLTTWPCRQIIFTSNIEYQNKKMTLKNVDQ